MEQRINDAIVDLELLQTLIRLKAAQGIDLRDVADFARLAKVALNEKGIIVALSLLAVIHEFLHDSQRKVFNLEQIDRTVSHIEATLRGPQRPPAAMGEGP